MIRPHEQLSYDELNKQVTQLLAEIVVRGNQTCYDELNDAEKQSPFSAFGIDKDTAAAYLIDSDIAADTAAVVKAIQSSM